MGTGEKKKKHREIEVDIFVLATYHLFVLPDTNDKYLSTKLCCLVQEVRHQ